MNAVIRKWIAPTYLFLCLVAGGSAPPDDSPATH